MKFLLHLVLICLALPLFAKESEKEVTNKYELASKFNMPANRKECIDRISRARTSEEKSRFRIGELKIKAANLRNTHDSLTGREEKEWSELLGKLGATPQTYNLYIEDLEIERRAVSGYAAQHGDDTSAWELALVSSDATVQAMRMQPVAMLQKSKPALTTLESTLATSKEELKTTKAQLSNKPAKPEPIIAAALVEEPKSQPQAIVKNNSPTTAPNQTELKQKPPQIDQEETAIELEQSQPTPIPEKVISIASSPPPTIVKSVIVGKGETLWMIAAKVYGDKNRWADIYWANKPKLENPEQISEGMELAIPK